MEVGLIQYFLSFIVSLVVNSRTYASAVIYMFCHSPSTPPCSHSLLQWSPAPPGLDPLGLGWPLLQSLPAPLSRVQRPGA